MSQYYRYDRTRTPRTNQLTLVILWTTVSVTAAQFMDGESGTIRQTCALFLPDLWSGAYWQLLSVTLVHDGPLHIFMNGYSLWIMGSILEPLLGKRSLLMLYVASALGGSIAIVLFNPLLGGVVGASGAIYGLFGALITYMYSKLGSMRAVWHSPVGRQLFILLAINIAVSFLPRISAAGHFGGLVVGAFVGYLIERHQSKRLVMGEKLGAWMLGLLVIGGSIYAAMPVHRGAYWLVKSGEAVNHRLGDRGWEYYEAGKTQDFDLARHYFQNIRVDVDKSENYGSLKEDMRAFLFDESHAVPVTPQHEADKEHPPAPTTTPA